MPYSTTAAFPKNLRRTTRSQEPCHMRRSSHVYSMGASCCPNSRSLKFLGNNSMNERFPHDRYDRPRGKPPFLRDEPPAALERNKGDDSSTAESFPERTIFNGQKLPPADVLRERARRGEWDVDIWRQQLLDAGFVRSDQDIRRDAHAQMTRRTFLRGAAATAAVGIAGATGLAGMTAIGEAKTFLKTADGIDLKVGIGKDHENIVGDHASMERTRDTLRHLVQELKRYPPDMIQKLGEGRGFQIHIVESRLIVKDKAPTGEIVMERYP